MHLSCGHSFRLHGRFLPYTLCRTKGLSSPPTPNHKYAFQKTLPSMLRQDFKHTTAPSDSDTLPATRVAFYSNAFPLERTL